MSLSQLSTQHLQVSLLTVILLVWLCSDKGMQHLTNVANWVELFDIVVVQARKPKFYFDTYRLVKTIS